MWILGKRYACASAPGCVSLHPGKTEERWEKGISSWRWYAISSGSGYGTDEKLPPLVGQCLKCHHWDPPIASSCVRSWPGRSSPYHIFSGHHLWPSTWHYRWKFWRGPWEEIAVPPTSVITVVTVNIGGSIADVQDLFGELPESSCCITMAEEQDSPQTKSDQFRPNQTNSGYWL